MRIEAGLDMLKFSMSNCLINFGRDYFQYGKEKDPLKRFLSIGEIDSVWLADLVACYILEQTESVFWTSSLISTFIVTVDVHWPGIHP